MAKVLISFLGTGRLVDKSKRVYDPVNYHLGDKDLGEYSFVGAAIKDFHEIDREKDKIIIIGSIHSMWEEIYKIFAPVNEFDPDTHVKIGVFCDDANSKTPLDSFEYKNVISNALGNNSQVVLIKYGYNEQEIQDNLRIILGIQQFLMPGDELIVDVTHSFRSLPIYIMQLLIFLKNIKKVKISKIYYGMFEMRTELGYAPIVDLSSILSVNDWIIGAYNFIEFGNTYKIAELLQNDHSGNYEVIANTAKKFADVKNLNCIKEFRSRLSSLSPLCNKDNLPELGKEVIAPVMEKFTKRFPPNLKQSVFQFRMADWHYSHHNYGYALTLIVEAIVTYCCEIYFAGTGTKELETLIKNKETRDLIKDALNEKTYVEDKKYQALVDGVSERLRFHIETDDNSSYSAFLSNWKTTNTDRNDIVHNIMRDDRSYEKIIEDLGRNINYFRKYMGQHTQ